jgi:hypothetical protein
MKLTIDDSNKIVSVEGEVPIGQLLERLKKLLPDDWQNYKFSGNINNINYIPYNPPLDTQPYPTTPWPGRDIWYTYGNL